MIRARVAVSVGALAVGWTVTAYADPVTHWNGIAATAVTAGRPGPPGLFDLALVHAAVHDAVQAIEGRFQPYHYTGSGTGSPAAAVAAAAHRVLVLLYPVQQGSLDAAYDLYKTANGLNAIHNRARRPGCSPAARPR